MSSANGHSSIDLDDVLGALDRMESQVTELRSRCAELRTAKHCPRCRRELRNETGLRAAVLAKVDRLAGWARALWP